MANATTDQRQLRIDAMRDSKVDTVIQECHTLGITLQDLYERANSGLYEHSTPSAGLASHRGAVRRKQIATNAVNARWNRYRGFLTGFTPHQEKVKQRAEQVKVPSPVVASSPKKKAPGPGPSTLESMLKGNKEEE